MKHLTNAGCRNAFPLRSKSSAATGVKVEMNIRVLKCLVIALIVGAVFYFLFLLLIVVTIFDGGVPSITNIVSEVFESTRNIFGLKASGSAIIVSAIWSACVIVISFILLFISSLNTT